MNNYRNTAKKVVNNVLEHEKYSEKDSNNISVNKEPILYKNMCKNELLVNLSNTLNSLQKYVQNKR
jgi:hypothetical protein